MELQEQLQTLGLNEKEAKVYLASLELGQSSVQDIARKSHIKRSTVYEIINNLIEQNLITIIPKGKKRYFLAAEPIKLTELIDQQQKVLAKMMPELEALSKISPTKPKIRFYEGIEGIKSIYADTIKEGKEIIGFVAVPEGLQSKIGNYLTNYVKQRSENKIMVKAIAPDSPSAREFQKRDQQELRQTKLIPEDAYPFSIEINIYGNKVSFISYKENELMGVIIESMEIAKTMKSIHKFFWDNLN